MTIASDAQGQEPSCGPPPEGFDAAWSRVAGSFTREAEARGVAGGTPWFVRHGEVPAKELQGRADQGPVTESTIFHWASKTPTGIGILQLRDRGLLDLEDPAVRWLPELLLEPGSRFGSSNPGVVSLRRILEFASGEPWEACAEKWILHPFGMHGNCFRHPPRTLGLTVSKGGLNAPVGDLVRYLGLRAGAGSEGETGQGALTRASLGELWRPVATVGEGAAWGEPHETIGVVNTDGVPGAGRTLDARTRRRRGRMSRTPEA